MLYNIKAMVVVLTLGATVLYLSKPLALPFMSADDYSRRRMVWLTLTGVSFLSPTFWIYALVAVPLLIWAYRRDSNPIALYAFLLHVIPPVGVIIPILGNNGLFQMDNFRLLAFCVLLPAVLRHRRLFKVFRQSSFGLMDILLLGLGALQIALYTCPDLPNHAFIPDSPTNVLRRAFLFFLDTYLLYYATSRLCTSRAMLLDVIASFCLASGVMAGIAIFEHAKDWLLYVDIASRWGIDPNASFYLTRGGALRAQASAGHSIALGDMLAVAFGFWLYLKSQIPDRKHRIAATVLLLGGLVATISRGAWLGAAIIYFTFNAAGPRALSRSTRGAVIAAAMAATILISPLGDMVLQLLPHSGQPADLYRHRLAERGWELVFAHPFFGDQFPWPEMENLRQGEGIIDMVDTYLGVGLNYGLVGLFCFVGFISFGMMKAYASTRRLLELDPGYARLGGSIVACIAGTLIMIDSNSFALGPQRVFFMLGGLALAFVHLTKPMPEASGPRTGNQLNQE